MKFKQSVLTNILGPNLIIFNNLHVAPRAHFGIKTLGSS